MKKIKLYNDISKEGLKILTDVSYEVSSELSNPDALLLRSYKLQEADIADSVIAIARAGVGLNNIPVSACTKKGIVVFNTPGANANSVKELVISALLLSSRKIIPAIEWTKKQVADKELVRRVEEKKSAFIGPEIAGKTLCVIGLGAVGVLVCNIAAKLGMRVIGYDPYISIKSAWQLSNEVESTENLDFLLNNANYLSIHSPLTEETKHIINEHSIAKMAKGIRILNFARAELVDNEAIIAGLKSSKIASYITDFPTTDLQNIENVISIPHLGASTPEAEDNCAVMASRQLIDYIESGNITNSANFPSCQLIRGSSYRISIINENIPNMLGQILTIIAKYKINISEMLNRHKDSIAYNIIDLSTEPKETMLRELRAISGIMQVKTHSLKY